MSDVPFKPKSVSGVLLKVDNLAQTVSFYERLGFRVGKQSKLSATVYVNWFWIEFILSGEQGATPGNGQFIYIAVEDIEQTYIFLQQNGFNPLNEPRKYPSGRFEVMISDTDGYKLVFFSK